MINKINILLLMIGLTLISCNSNKSDAFKMKVDPVVFSEEIFSIYQVTPDEAMEWMYDSTLALFIDLRKEDDYLLGRIENAINIPLSELLNNEYKANYDTWLNDSLRVVLYGENELQVNAAWMLMYQLGYTNMRVLLGGYDYIDRLYLDELAPGESFTMEDPRYDFAGIITKVKIEKEKPREIPVPVKANVQKKKEVEVVKKVKKPAEGGC